MKIIKHGNRRKTCEKCNCIFEFDKEDILTKETKTFEDVGFMFPNYTSITWILEVVHCPECNNEIEISAKTK